MDLQLAVYRRNNGGQPTVWYGEVVGPNIIKVHHGILGKTITIEPINTGKRKAADELASRYKSKGKSGYKYLSDVTDQVILPVEETHVIAFLNTYLPYDRQSSSGAMLPMLAKLYDNKNNKLFKDNKRWIAQAKINGLRCGIGATTNGADIFKPIKLTFQSREGIYWDSLDNLEDYLLSVLPSKLLYLMVQENYILDGELYLYGHASTTINSFVKNPKVAENKLIQFWCYDVAIPDMSQSKRFDILEEHLEGYQFPIVNKEDHKDNKERLVLLENFYCANGHSATSLRDRFIDLDFEGLILRDEDEEYQFGKRNSAMIKYKATTDGKFTIVDIVPEGDKRDLPLLVLRNDINDATFKCSVSGSFEYQKKVLDNKDFYITKKAFVVYGERSGVTEVPFHIKDVHILEE